MPVNGNQKGKRGEREAAQELSCVAGTWRRSKQYNGLEGLGDIVCDEDEALHCEVKRELKSVALEDAIDQASEDVDAREDTEACVPFVMHRRNGRDWLITVQASDLRAFVERWYHLMEED